MAALEWEPAAVSAAESVVVPAAASAAKSARVALLSLLKAKVLQLAIWKASMSFATPSPAL